jgi:ankyrin repeat protein
LIRKSVTELQFVRTRNPMSTVEIDVDSIPSDRSGYGYLVEQALAKLSRRWPELRATVYVSHRTSSSFGRYSNSAFFGVAGDKRVLDALHGLFSGVRDLKVRYSDAILASEAICQYHVEDARFWRPLEEGTWYADEEAVEDSGATDDGPVVPGPVVEQSPEVRIFAAARGPGQSRQGDWDKVFDLLAHHGIRPERIVCPKTGYSLLTVAATEPAPEACEKLLQLGADPAFGGNVGARSALTMMVWLRSKPWGSKHRKIVELLAPGTVNHQDSEGRTALMFASVGAGLFGMKRGNPQIIDQLMRHGADPSIESRYGRTALMQAVESNDRSPTSANWDVIALLESHSIDYAAKQWFMREKRAEFAEDGRMIIAPVKESGQPKAIRKDAFVGTVTKKMEDHFGLPAGSVALVDRKRKVLRDEDTIGTLRKRHD